jgi:hypothetical protein
MVTNGAPALCPLFGKCDGFLVIDQDNNIREFYPNEDRTADSLCDLIVKSGAGRLVCGFIPEPAKRRLADRRDRCAAGRVHALRRRARTMRVRASEGLETSAHLGGAAPYRSFRSDLASEILT